MLLLCHAAPWWLNLYISSYSTWGLLLTDLRADFHQQGTGSVLLPAPDFRVEENESQREKQKADRCMQKQKENSQIINMIHRLTATVYNLSLS